MDQVAWYFRDNGTAGLLEQMRDGVGTWSGETIDQLRKSFPNAQAGTIEEFSVAVRESYRRPPQRITEEEWMDALESLPPMRWVRSNGFESFCFMEAITCNIHSIYARLGDTYWHMADDIQECTPEAVEDAVREAAQPSGEL